MIERIGEIWSDLSSRHICSYIQCAQPISCQSILYPESSTRFLVTKAGNDLATTLRNDQWIAITKVNKRKY